MTFSSCSVLMDLALEGQGQTSRYYSKEGSQAGTPACHEVQPAWGQPGPQSPRGHGLLPSYLSYLSSCPMTLYLLARLGFSWLWSGLLCRATGVRVEET